MIKEFLEIKETDSLDDLRARFAGVIGWKEPVPAAAFLRAVEDPEYAAALITSRNTPGFLEPLLTDPRNATYAPALASQASAISNTELLANAARAMLQWGKAGFTIADTETIARREKACLSCEHLTAPKKLLQKLLPARPVRDEVGQRTGDKTCDLCGCQVTKKMRIPTETCPAAHPSAPGMNRWMEPLLASQS